MELVTGCTLTAEDVARIEQGLDLREVLAARLAGALATPSEVSDDQREHLGWLAWMVAHRLLDIKVAIPKGHPGKPLAGVGLVHAKMGLITDASGNTLVFSGSLNETEAGWKHNWESFSVSCSWRGEWDQKRIAKAEADFAALWTNTARSAEVFDVPDAIRKRLLAFIPANDPRLVGGEADPAPRSSAPAVQEVPPPPPGKPDLRPRIWGFLRDCPRRPADGHTVAIVSSTVEPWPHQLRAYQRMLASWPVRLLIADEVGLGKTIEAGLLIRHLWISGKACRILILAPKGVLRQWQGELYEKFNLLVPIYTGQTLVRPAHHAAAGPLERPAGATVWADEPLLLVSSQLARRRDRQNELLGAPNWDLIVCDEAHHARRRGAGTEQEGGANLFLRLLRQLKDKTASLLLMTATPMQVAPVEVWDLLDLLGLPPEWTAEVFVEFFETLHRAEKAEDLARLAGLFRACERAYGPLPESEIDRVAEQLQWTPIDRKKIMDALRTTAGLIPLKRLTDKQREGTKAILKIGSPVRALMSRHTRTLLREYHRRGLLTKNVPRREVTDLPVVMSAQERALYQAVEEYITTTWKAASKKQKPAVGFVLTVYRRRMASSFHALRQTLNASLERLDARQPPPDPRREAAMDEDMPDDTEGELCPIESPEEAFDEVRTIEKREGILDLLRGIARLGTDTKAIRLEQEIGQLLRGGFDAVIVFTQYTDTMDFLKDFLAERLEVPIGCFSGLGGQYRDSSGAWVTCTKEEIKRFFQTRKIQVMICTDAAGEGLNLQTCGALVNYDLPWNPMRVEQRIGRIDRIGQRYPAVRVLNLAYAETIEADIYFALSRRISLFNGVVGRLQPILARLPIEFERAVLTGLTEPAQTREAVVNGVLDQVDLANQAAFDIDAVSDADLHPPDLPPPPVTPGDLDRILQDPALLPDGVTCRPLDPQTYALQVPGMTEPARVTTSPAIFDDHFESHQLLWHGSPLFSSAVSLGGTGAGPAQDSSENGGLTEVALNDLLDRVPKPPTGEG